MIEGGRGEAKRERAAWRASARSDQDAA
ncbi:hypothetical protein TCAP_05443, partial [Tolypocladium capitatum]